MYGLPFASGPTGTTQPNTSWVYPGSWMQGDTTDWTTTGTDTEALWCSGSGSSRFSTLCNIHDPDGVVRPADAWIGGINSTLTASPENYLNDSGTNSLRPVILHRPFRSVAELGYVFRDTPWKTLSFFDNTSQGKTGTAPDSGGNGLNGDGALLDLFSIADEPSVVAGRPNLNTTQPLVQQALLSGTGQAPDGTSLLSNPGGIATAYQSYAAGTMPMNLGQLVNFMTSTQFLAPTAYPLSVTNVQNTKNYRESVMRSLAGNTQTRTWNLLIDVVAQTGRYPSTATSLNNFLVEGEKRYWLSVAIDRYTGKIISEQLEAANE